MRSLLVAVMLSSLLRGQTFNSTVDHVAIPVTLHSDLNGPITDLRPADFRVFDDGRPVPIVAFGRIRQSVHLVLLLDTSRSMVHSLADVRSAATAVITHLGSGDSVQVGTFSSFLRLSPPLSANDNRLAARLKMTAGENVTMLYDALVEGCEAFTTEMDRRVIFVVSDGTDTGSAATTRKVIQRAAETNVTIYAVALNSRDIERGKPIIRPPDPSLREIAEATGGGYVYAGTGRDFSRVFASMIEELHQQYMLGFTPALRDGRLHSLTVTTRRPSLRIRARKQYLAPAP